MKWPFQLAQFSRTQGFGLKVTSYKVPVSASASFTVRSIVACLIASGRPGFVLMLSRAFPSISDDFVASCAVALGICGEEVIYLPWKRLRWREPTDCGVAIEPRFSMTLVWFVPFLKAVLCFTLILSMPFCSCLLFFFLTKIRRSFHGGFFRFHP